MSADSLKHEFLLKVHCHTFEGFSFNDGKLVPNKGKIILIAGEVVFCVGFTNDLVSVTETSGRCWVMKVLTGKHKLQYICVPLRDPITHVLFRELFVRVEPDPINKALGSAFVS